MNSAEMKLDVPRGPTTSGDERRASVLPDRRAPLALAQPISAEQLRRRSAQMLPALADVLARNSGGTVALPRQLAEIVHSELERLSGGLWDAQDVARFLGVHRNWVYLQAEAGSLPCVRIGGLVRFEPEIIRAIGRGQQIKGGRVIAMPVARKRNDRK